MESSSPREVHPYDLRLLTAKAVSFRTMVRFEASDRTKLAPQTRKTLLLNLTNLQSFMGLGSNDQDLSDSLEATAQTLEILLGLSIESQQVKRFVDDFRSEARHYKSIRAELESWLDVMREYSLRYLPLASSLSLRILLAAPEWCDPPLEQIISAITHAQEEGRQITLYLRSDALDLDTYFEIPGILSHEFWCHSLSSIQASGQESEQAPWRGCDPEDSWEEGWMDFIQNTILRSPDFPTPPQYHTWLVPQLHKSCHGYEIQRADPANGHQRSRGWSAALHAQRFFHQCFPAYSPDEILIEFSVKINSINSLSGSKRVVVDLFLKHLAYSEQDQSVQTSLNQLVRGRAELYHLISPCFRIDTASRHVTIDVEGLLKIVENS